MARDLTQHVARHNDPHSQQHEVDKAEARERRRKRQVPTGWDEVPGIARNPGNRVIECVFRSQSKGWCFLMSSTGPRVVAGAEYVKSATARARKLAKGKRRREREGRVTVDPVAFKSGLQSIVLTLPPWAVRTVESIGPSERDDLLRHLISSIAKEAETASGRKLFSGACHLDTAVPHFHCDLEKVDEAGFVHPKNLARTGGPWLVGADRMEREFPGLLGSLEREKFERAMARKGDLLDVRLARCIDEKLARWIEARGLSAKYRREREAYAAAKRKAQGRVAEERIVESALEIFARKGIWLLSYRSMSFAMWRMIPAEVRKPIALAIRSVQTVRKVQRALDRIEGDLVYGHRPMTIERISISP